MSTPQSKTPALDLEAAEKELDALAEQTKAAYKAYREADDAQAGMAAEVRVLKRQVREGGPAKLTPEEIGARRAAELFANGTDENWLGAR